MKYAIGLLAMLGIPLGLAQGCSGGDKTFILPADGGSGSPSAGGSEASGGNAGAGQSGGATSGGSGGASAGGSAGNGSGGASAGGSAGAGGTQAQVGCTNALMIDDIEDGDSAICPGRMGGWYVSYQEEGAGVPTPTPGTVIMGTPIADRPGSSYAMSFSGAGFAGPDHWALIALSLDDGSGSYNSSTYSGLRFWGRSTTGAAVALRVTFPSLASTDAQFGGTCLPVNELLCGDHWMAARTLTPTWQQFEIYFANDLAQAGWGVPVAKDLAHELGVEFQYQSSDNAEAGNFAFLIDDVSFY